MKDEIINTLVPDRDFSLVDVLVDQVAFSYPEKVAAAEAAISAIENEDDFIYKTALFTAADSFGNVHRNQRLILLAIEYEKNHQVEIKNALIDSLKSRLSDLSGEARTDLLDRRFSNSTVVFDYIGEFFGDDIAKEIVEIAGVSPATSKKYLRGSSPQWTTYYTFLILAKTFFILETEMAMSKKEALNWYMTPQIPEADTMISLRDLLIANRFFPHRVERKLLEEGIQII